MLPYNRALHPSDYDHPDLKPHIAAIDGFERTLQGIWYRKDHLHRAWEYGNCIRQMAELFPSGARLLIHDTGSGGSYWPLYLKKAGHEVSVSDSLAYGGNSLKMLISQCLKLKIRIPFKQEPVERLVSYSDNAFDVTCCVSVIEHVQPEAYEQAWRELCRVTKPGGYLFVTSDYFVSTAQGDSSPHRRIQHNRLTRERVEEIPTMIPASFVGGADLTYRGDWVNNYSFINLCLQKQKAT